MPVRIAVLVGALLAASAADATEVGLKDGTTLEGRIIGEEVTHLTIRVPVTQSVGGGTIEGSAERRIAWGDVRAIDGLSIADWKRLQAARGAGGTTNVADGGASDSRPLTLSPRGWLEDYSAWIESGEGFGMGFRLAAIVGLVLLPALLLLLGGRVLVLEQVDGLRAFGAALIALGAGATLLSMWPGWIGDWPAGAMAGVIVAIWLVVRPPPVRGVVLAGLELAGLAGAVLAALLVSGSLS